MKKIFMFIAVSVLIVTLSACGTDNSVELQDLQDQIDSLNTEVATLEDDLSTTQNDLADVEADLSGTYVGYSWKGNATGTLLEDATQKIETRLTLDEDGVILDAKVLFWKLSGGSWYTRQDGTAHVDADLDITPVAAVPGSSYTKGTSMFSVDTHDLMSLYAVVVEADGSAAFMFVDPTTRYQFEISLPMDYDYSTLVGAVTVNGTPGGFIPTVRTSGSGLKKPELWSELDGKNMFNISGFNHVISDYGVFDGVTATSTMQELLEAAGVTFTTTVPDVFELEFGRHSNGGWQGNYEAIEDYLIGMNVNDITSLVDWEVTKWADAINDDNLFGIDLLAGATKTAQDSFDTIAGATVRMSRESTSFQRVLVAIGVLSEEDVVVGRF